jgi:hypothetical protein
MHPVLTERHVQLFQKRLPSLSATRGLLFPYVLRDWWENELLGILLATDVQSWGRRQARLKKISKSAAAFAAALGALDKGDYWLLASALSEHKDAPNEWGAEVQQHLPHLQALLIDLATVATKHHRSGIGRGKNRFAYPIMQDLAAIYEWMTVRMAQRSVDRSEGDECGPFWDFASAVWPVIFGKGDTGLYFAIKAWAENQSPDRLDEWKQAQAGDPEMWNWQGALDRHGNRSPAVINMSIRHPEWRKV